MAIAPRPSSIRLLCALAATLVAIAIGVRRQHIHISPSDLTTYPSILDHRCGLLIVLCIAWALAELALLLLPVRAPAS